VMEVGSTMLPGVGELNTIAAHTRMSLFVVQRVAVCCSVLQCVAVCCSVLQCVAACSSHTNITMCTSFTLLPLTHAYAYNCLASMSFALPLPTHACHYMRLLSTIESHARVYLLLPLASRRAWHYCCPHMRVTLRAYSAL